MKLFGYELGNDEQETPMPLSEATIVTTPAELRNIAKVLAEFADEMEMPGFGHAHLADRLSGLSSGADLIVIKAG
jgi:hypothetical protein